MLRGKTSLRLVVRRRHGDAGRWRAGEKGVALRGVDSGRLIDDADRDGLVGTGLHAGRRFAFDQAIGAHVAFAHDALFGAVLRRFIGAGENAVLAADALVVEVVHNAGERVFFIRAHGTPMHAGRLQTVMACGGHGFLHRRLRAAAVQQADNAPGFARFEPVQAVARRDARLATSAAIEIDFKAVLLAGAGRGKRNQAAVVWRLRWLCMAVVKLREALDRSEVLLLGEQGGEQRGGRRRWRRLGR